MASPRGSNDPSNGRLKEILIEADMMGHSTHGVRLLPLYIKDIKNGNMRITGDESIIKDTGSCITIDGKNFDGGKAESQSIVIGAGQYLPDLEKGLVGLKSGDEKDIKVKFPENYGQKDLQSAEAVFDCNIKKISTPQESKVNDEFSF